MSFPSSLLPLSLALFAGPLASPAKPAAAIAMVADLEGRATLEGGRVLQLMDEVPLGKPLTLAAGSRVVLVNLQNGDELVFKGPGRLSFKAPGLSQGLQPAEVRKHPAMGDLRLRLGGMRQAALVMRSGDPAQTLEVWPKGPRVLDAAPRFRWEPLGPQATYQFKLFDAQGGLFLDRTLEGTSLELPGLLPGKPYTWILEARPQAKPPSVRTGRIQVVDEATRGLLAQCRPASSAPFTERLVYAMLLEDSQVGDEASLAWKALAQERPGDARLKTLAGR